MQKDQNASKDDDTHARFSQEVGLGLSIYLKQLKLFGLMFLVFCIFNIPAFWFFYSGKQSNVQNFYDLRGIFSTFTLGNLGSSNQICMQVNATAPIQQFQCSFGVMDSLQVFVMADNKTNNCSNSNLYKKTPIKGITNVTQACNLTNDTSIISYFNGTCKGKKSCQFPFGDSYFPAECRQPEYQRFVGIDCVGSDIPIIENHQIYVTRYDLTIVVIAFDLFVVVTFAVIAQLMLKWIDDEQLANDLDFVQITDFAVRIKNLPHPDTYNRNLNVLRVMLTLHLQKVIDQEPQVIEKLEGRQTDGAQVDEIVQIHFGKTKFGQYEIMQDIQNLTNEGSNLTLQKLRQSDERKKQNLEIQIQRVKHRIQKKIDRYRVEQQKASKGEIKCAFVVFRSMEGAARCLQAYSDNGRCQGCDRVFGACCRQRCACLMKQDYCKVKYREYKFFNKRWLDVDEAIQPSLILWQNLGYTKIQRCSRILFTILIGMMLISATVIVTIYMSSVERDIQNISPQVHCDFNQTITSDQALIDFNYPITQQQGFMYCFCKDLFNQNLKKIGHNIFQLDYEFSDGQKHCQQWVNNYLTSSVLTLVVPLVISIINYCSKLAMGLLSQFVKYQSETTRLYHSSINMTAMYFINLAVIILLVNFRIDERLEIPILQGNYNTFSVDWYRLVGSSLCVSMLILAFSSSFSYICWALLTYITRWYDRGFTQDIRNTRKLTQHDYEQMYTGPEFLINWRYCNNLTVIFVTMLYGSGMPFLYVFATVYFFLMYVTDKWLLFNYYRKAAYYDEKLSRKTADLLKLGLLLHLIGGVLMLSDSSILPSLPGDTIQRFRQISTTFGLIEYNEYITSQMLIYVSTYLLILIVYICWDFILIRIVSCWQQSQVYKKRKHQREVAEPDLYTCVNFNTLKLELLDTKKCIETCTKMQKSADCYNQNFNESDLKQYIEQLNRKKYSLGRQIYDIAEKQLDFQRLSLQRIYDPKVDQQKLIDRCIQELELAQQNGHVQDCKIKEELQSYNLMHNTLYSPMHGLRNLLNRYNKQSSKSNNRLSALSP